MRIRFLAIILISFLGIFNFLFKNSASAETISVCSSGCNYSTIGEAVNQAKAGDLILVGDGSYNESVTIDKPLIIKSENGPEKCTVYHLGFPFIISTSSVQIEGFTLIGTSMWGYWGPTGGIFLNGNNNTIINNVFLNSDYGIYLKDANQNIIKNNTFKNINHGIYFFSSSSENEISDNYLETNTSGIKLYGNNNKIKGNTISAKGKYGIWILNSRNNYLSNNSLTNSGIYVGGRTIDDYSQEIDGTNKVNGKPLYYCKNKENETAPEAGQVILFNCKNIFIENQQISNLPAAIEIVSSSDIMINNSVLSNNDYGIFTFSSKNIVIENSSFQNNWQSVVLENSNNSTIKNNNFSFNDYPLTLSGSNWNIIQNDTFKNNFYALIISGSESNKIDYNQFMSNNLAIFLKSGSKRNEIIHNNLKENQNTLYLYDLPPKENSFYLNNFIKNARNLHISSNGMVLWNSKEKINYSFDRSPFSNYLGNYWDDYENQNKEARDGNKDGICDTSYKIASWGGVTHNDDFPLVEPFESYFLLQKWKFENEFLLDLDGNSKTVEGKGYTLGNVYLSEIEPGFDALKIEGRISLEGDLPNQIPKIYLIATDGMDKEIASTSIPFNLISFSQIDKKIYSFSLSLLNPPKPINGGHYEVYLELGNNPLLINTTSKISKHYFPLIYFPEKKVLIYEVYYNTATGTDPDNEWVIIHNLENETIDISNWQICDNVECDKIPTSSIPANGFAIITASSTTFDLWKIPKGMTKIVLEDKRIGNALANSGDRVILKDRYGNIIDAMSYGDDKSIFDNPPKAREGYSLLRDPPEKDTDTGEDFKESEPTIGKNRLPIPIISYFPKNPVKGVKVKFDASLSDDPDGKIVNFEWQIGTSTSTGTTTEFIFNENGTTSITLTVTDNDGATSSTSTIIKVEPFSFAIITDSHIGRGYPDYDGPGFDDGYNGEEYYLTQRLRNVVNWIIQNKDNIQCEDATCSIKFLIVLGDIADSGEKSEFLKAKEILDELNNHGIPYVPVFGNHDVWPKTDLGDRAESPLGVNYFEEVFFDGNATNTRLLKEKLNLTREDFQYKNYLFKFGGINFIVLDFITRKDVGKATLHEQTINWLKEKLNEFQGKEPIILFSHHPLTPERSREFYGRQIIPFPETNFDPRQIEKLAEMLQEYESLTEGKQILGTFGGHVHGYYPQEIFAFKVPELNWFFDANWQYPSLSTIPVLTTEALMVGSNREDEYLRENNKGIIRIVKILDNQTINFDEIEGKYDPDSGTGEDFIGLHPYISRGYTASLPNTSSCFFFKAHAFTKREVSFLWDFGDNTTSSHAWVPLKCYENPGTYNVKLILKDNKTGKEEFITRIITAAREGFVSKTLKLADSTLEKVKIISREFSEDLKEIMKRVGNIALDFQDQILFQVETTHSEKAFVPVANFTVHFEKAKGDISLSNLKIDSDSQKGKTLFYSSKWPEEIEKKKILFVPK
jgi:parallel beta-helix repeat protein